MNRNNTVFLGILGWCYDCLVCSLRFMYTQAIGFIFLLIFNKPSISLNRGIDGFFFYYPMFLVYLPISGMHWV
nr:MAG TPA: hypothetical protein [Caudoviricetes sp.]